MKSLLIGFGSIGRRHLRELASRSSEVVVFDFKNSFPEILELVENATFYSDWDQLVTQNKNIDFAVISTWGPNHLEQLKNVSNLGVHSVLIEKPLASSLRDIVEIKKIVEKHEMRLFENFHYRYSNFKSAVVELEHNFNLGKLLQFNVSGGAKCLATTGIHYLDLCEWIFSSRPKSVISDVDFAYINPRSPNLRMYGGLVRWTYPSLNTLTLNFSNDSYCDSTIEIIWKNAKAVFEDESLTLFGPEDFPNFDPLTTARVKPFNKVLSRVHAIRDESGNDGMTNLYNAFFDLREKYRNPNPGSSTSDLLNALISHKINQRIGQSDHADNYFEFDWEIS